MLYQEHHRYFVQVARGTEEPAEAELSALGARPVLRATGGVEVEADRETMWRMNYGSRLALRVFAPLTAFDCPDADALYAAARTVPWRALMRGDQRFAVSANVTGHPGLRHGPFAALKVKDAVADTFRDATGARPDVDAARPDLAIHLHIRGRRGTLYADTSGGSLHRRGYRRRSVDAPMQEALAAAVLAFSAWDGQTPLYDPFCGSGTILCEALMKAAAVPPGCLRTRFGFEQLPDYDAEAWRGLRAAMDGAVRAIPEGLVGGGDLDPAAVEAARANLDTLPQGPGVRVRRQDAREWTGLERGIIVANPPYGRRSGDPREVPVLLKHFGDVLKRRCRGSNAWLYFGDPQLVRCVGLKPARTLPLNNGGLDGILAHYPLY